MHDKHEILRHLYERFNARDVDGVFAFLQDDVLWANGMEGGHVRGKEAVRQYWTRQWTMFDPRVEPIGFSDESDSRIIVDVHQVVRDLEGKLLADDMVGHIFSFDGPLVRRFDIRGAEPDQASAAFRR